MTPRKPRALPGGSTLDLGLWFIPLAVVAIFGSAAGVNEVDGLDGLAGGTTLFAFGCYLIIALATVVGHALRVAGAKPVMALRYE